MISILILLILAWAFYIGYSRGLVLQVYYSLAALISMLLAGQFYQGLASFLSLWVPYASATQGSSTYFFPNNLLFQLDKVFYAGLAYLLLFSFFYSLARFLGIFIHLIPKGSTESTSLNITGGILAVLVALFSLQMCLTILATIPMSLIQDQLNASGLARFIINHTPLTSGLLRDLWLTKIIG
ncbi:CvpA family protein [Streptococcus oricebi]|uniref:Colicin V production protein n=1 Tax=Streptococcus oricebi TaxID=1547447 RepID=A0ABS5B5G8_9STRE|nr:CvpA family protein [Streptococcus oricebi]MBP2623726.1 colicin V production protein [Streptococcus oricebi]